MHEVNRVGLEGPGLRAVVNLTICLLDKIKERDRGKGAKQGQRGRDRAYAYNFKFGGIQVGWMGEISVPTTSQFGYSSAKSLRIWLEVNMLSGLAARTWPRTLSPYRYLQPSVRIVRVGYSFTKELVLSDVPGCHPLGEVGTACRRG